MVGLITLAALVLPAVDAADLGVSLRGVEVGGAITRHLLNRETEHYVHLGCYNHDVGDDSMFGEFMTDPNMNTKVCHDFCTVYGALYMATASGDGCWCSRDADVEYARHGFGACDTYCVGDAADTCGGRTAFDVYELTHAETSTDPEYMGCYADDEDNDIMTNEMFRDDMHVRLCHDHCRTSGHMYYAIQFGRECWCGVSDTFADYEQNGQGLCHMPCAGDEHTACGGYEAFSLFRFLGDGNPSQLMPANPTPTHVTILEPAPEGPTPAPARADPTTSPVVPPTPTSPTPYPTANVQPPTRLTPYPTMAVDATPAPESRAQATAMPLQSASTSASEATSDDLFIGDGTYYGATSGGNCAFGTNVPSIYDRMTAVAVGFDRYDGSLGCGACIEGEGSGVGLGADPITGPFQAYIADKCPECAAGDLDFAQSGDGRWDISWRFVACPSSATPDFIFEGSNDFYWKIQPRGTNVPVSELTVSGVQGRRVDDNFFVVDSGGPFVGPQTVVTITRNGVVAVQEVTRT